MSSTAWQPPEFAAHGDRQVIYGQRIAGPLSSDFNQLRIDAYIQVGRAISGVNPVYLPDAPQPAKVATTAIDASAAALEGVFGKG